MTEQNVTGQAGYTDTGSDYTSNEFHIQQFMGKIWTSIPCKVLAVTPSGTGKAIGTVTVQPLVNQVDGQGKTNTPHGPINGVAYFRIQGGANAIIIDPQVNDIGVIFASARDISLVKSTQAAANPGSFRQFDLADSFYLGGSLNAAPTQFVQFSGANMNITSTGTLTITAPSIVLDGNVSSMGSLSNNGHLVGSTHLHTGVQLGSSDSGPPV